MSTINVTNVKHPSAVDPAIVLDADGGMSGAFPSPNRNLLYNGAMQVHQRGTSTAGITTTGYYTADRWRSIITIGTWTQSIEDDGPAGSGFTKSLKMLCTTADAAPSGTGQAQLRQTLEGYDVQRTAKGTASALQTTISFWVKSNVTGTYNLEAYDLDNTRQISASYSISSSATWEKKTITFPADTTGTFNNDNAGSLILLWWLSSGSNYTSGTLNTSWAASVNANRATGQTNLVAATNNYWQVTGVQLEVGAAATEFEFEPYGTTLAKCQRYYFQSHKYGQTYNVDTYGGLYHSYAKGGGQWEWSWSYLPVEMRAVPTATTSDKAGNIGKISHWTSIGGGSSDNHTPYTVYAAKNSIIVTEYNTASIYGFNYHLKADAEL
jgi:hypothetical protein